MPLQKELKSEIEKYCNNHLPPDSWYEDEFSVIQDANLKKRIIAEFKSIRFAYKLYEGIGAEGENLMFEVRNQILAYASIYEVVIENVIDTYYSNTPEFESLMYHEMPIRIDIPERKQCELQSALSHDGKTIVPYYFAKRKKEKAKVRFDEKCSTAEKLGLIHKYVNERGEEIDLPAEIKEIYSYRNGIHILAEQRKGITYELDLSKRAYRRMRPFIDQIKERLMADGKLSS